MKKISLIKFTAVAIMLGLFSPSLSLKVETQSTHNYNMMPIEISISLLQSAEARRNRGGGANRNRNSNRNSNRNVNRNSNKNTNRNVNVNRNTNRNVNVNVNHNSRYYGGRRSYGSYGGRPILAFAAGMAIGSMITAASMPPSCTTIITSGVTYRKCGSSYYQPHYQGDTVVYQVVNSPY